MRSPVRTVGIAALALVSIAASFSLAGATPQVALPRMVFPNGPGVVAGADPDARTGTGTGTVVRTAKAAPPAGSLTAGAGLAELKAGGASLAVDRSGVVRSATAPTGRVLAKDVDGFVKRFAGTFGLTSAHHLVKQGTTVLPGGDTVTRYQQRAGNLPVLGGDVVVTADRSGGVRGAIGDTTRLAPVATSAKVSGSTAQAAGLAAFVKKFPPAEGHVRAAGADLWLLDPSVLGMPGGGQLRPTYWVKLVGRDGGEFGTALVDALDGTVRLVANERQTARSRIVCDLANRRVDLNDQANYLCVDGTALAQPGTTRREGSPASPVADVNAAWTHLDAAYNFFLKQFGLDSYDGHGARLHATVQACHIGWDCPYGNAFWDDTQFVFGQGYATDDVVAHEYTHAVTAHGSGLYYWFQSGAINEALSDILGQLVDLSTPADDAGDLRWMIGEDLPPADGALRHMANPERFAQPRRVGGPYWTVDPQMLDNGGVHTNSGPANYAAHLMMDGSPGQGIPGLGLTKSAQLWYRVLHLLPSGANYQELGLTLKAACRQLIGHYDVTAADCTGTVEWAIGVVGMYGPDDAPPPYQEAEFQICDNTTQTPQDLFFEDFETDSSKWTFSNTYYWDRIPSAVIDYSYAAAGRGSLNGWTNGNGAGHGVYVEMKQPVTIPTGKPVYAHFNFSMINVSPGSVDLFINRGTGWQPLNVAHDSRFIGNRQTQMTGGYGATRIDLAPYAGQSVRLRFQVNSPNRLVDWYMDNLRLYTCDATKSGLPRDVHGYFDNTGLHLGVARSYVGLTSGGGQQSYSFEVSYSPAIPGAPTSFQAPNPDGPWTFLAPGADPSDTYTVTVAIRTADGQLGPRATIVVSPDLALVCPSSPPTGVILPPTRRPRPAAPDGRCFLPVVPRR